jgi:hypothetical protein
MWAFVAASAVGDSPLVPRDCTGSWVACRPAVEATVVADPPPQPTTARAVATMALSKSTLTGPWSHPAGSSASSRKAPAAPTSRFAYWRG